MNAGDVCWVEFPSRNGHAQAERRPAIMAQDASATSRLPTILAIPLTTQLASLRCPGTVLVDADSDNGLRHPSVASVFQLAAVDQRFLRSKMGRASQAVMDAIWDSLDNQTGRKS